MEDDLQEKMELPQRFAKQRSPQENLKKVSFSTYAVHKTLYHADIANGQGISQKGVEKQFATGHWLMLDNVFEKFQIRRYTPNASLLYIVAEKNFGNLIRAQLG